MLKAIQAAKQAAQAAASPLTNPGSGSRLPGDAECRQPSQSDTYAHGTPPTIAQPQEAHWTTRLWTAALLFSNPLGHTPTRFKAGRAAGLFSRDAQTRQQQWQGLTDFSQRAEAALRAGQPGPPREAYYQLMAGLIEEPLHYAQQRYGEEAGHLAHDKLGALSNDALSLLADPGLVSRVEGFVQFAPEANVSYDQPWALREAFSEHLGNVQLFRGARMSKQTVGDISRSIGFVPSVFRDAGTYAPEQLIRIGTEPVQRLQARHVLPPMSRDPSSPFISTTPSRRIAENNIGTAMFGLEHPITVFTLSMPVLDTLPTNGRFAFAGEAEQSIFFHVAHHEITEAAVSNELHPDPAGILGFDTVDTD